MNDKLDHYYTASILGKGFGTLKIDKNGKISGGRLWDVNVINLEKLNNTSYSSIINLKKFLAFNKKQYSNDKALKKIKASKIFTDKNLKEPNNIITKKIEDEINKYISIENSELQFDKDSIVWIGNLMKEFFIKSPIVNNYTYEDYNSISKKQLEKNFDLIFPIEECNIMMLSIKEKNGFIIDTCPIIFINDLFLNKYTKTSLYTSEYNFLIWYYSPTYCFILYKRGEKFKQFINQLIKSKEFYTFCLLHFCSKAFKYVVFDESNNFLLEYILKNKNKFPFIPKTFPINIKNNMHTEDS